jgi:hypothetical protein
LTNIDLNYYQVTIPSSDVSNSDEIRTGIFRQAGEFNPQKSSATAPETVSVDIAQITITANVVNQFNTKISDLVITDFEITGTHADKLTITQVTENNDNYNITATTTIVAGTYTYNLVVLGETIQENMTLQTLPGIPHIDSIVNRTSPEIVCSRERETTVVATVVDQHNNAITGLTKEDFAVTSESTFTVTQSIPNQNTYTLTIQTPEDIGSYTPTLTAKTIAIGIFTIEVAVREFSSGDGTEISPYEITSWYHLHNIRNHLNKEDVYFKLMNDLDKDSSGYHEFASNQADSGKGWNPIGVLASQFRGTIDGNDYTISDLYINRAQQGTEYIGLFGFVSDASITNLKLSNINITSLRYVGALVGYALDTEFKNIHLTNANIKGTLGVGGLIGLAGGSSQIYNCSVSGRIEGEGALGGLVGLLDRSNIAAPSVERSYSNATVMGTGSGVGGLVGLASGHESHRIIIKRCYTLNESAVTKVESTGTGNTIYVGGLVGHMSQTIITECYSKISVKATNGVIGGLVGYMNYAQINNSYYVEGKIEGNNRVGGLVGQIHMSSQVINSYFATFINTANYGSAMLRPFIAVSNTANPLFNSYYDSTLWLGSTTYEGNRTTIQMKEGTPSEDIYKDWSTDIWYFGTNTEYPILKYWKLMEDGIVSYTLKMEKEGDGTISPDVGTYDYPEGTNVTISATPTVFSLFKEWVGDVEDKNNLTTTVNMDFNKIVRAVFDSRLIVNPSTATNVKAGEILELTYTFIGYNQQSVQLSVEGNLKGRFSLNSDMSSSTFDITTLNGTTDENGQLKVYFRDYFTMPENIQNKGKVKAQIGEAFISTGDITVVANEMNASYTTIERTSALNTVNTPNNYTLKITLRDEYYNLITQQKTFTVKIIHDENIWETLENHVFTNGISTITKTQSDLGTYNGIKVKLNDEEIGTFDLIVKKEFEGGDGTENAPFQITDWFQLHNVKNYVGEHPDKANKHFKLMNNLDETSTGYHEYASSQANDGQGWVPIGENQGYFDVFIGKFDGNNKTISDLYINRPSTARQGLFGSTKDSEFKDLNLTNIEIIGHTYIAALVANPQGNNIIENIHASNIKLTDLNLTGDFNGTGGLVGSGSVTIRNSSSEGTITAGNSVGGLAGNLYFGSIENSSSFVKVEGNNYIGGLVGRMDSSKIEKSYTSYTDFDSFSVIGNSYVGGLVGSFEGSNSSSHNIKESFSTVNVKGTDRIIGGLVGMINGYSLIENSYATGKVETPQIAIGGLVGNNLGSVRNSYAIGEVVTNKTSFEEKGGLIGYGNSGWVESSYYDTQTTKQTDEESPNRKGIGKTTIEMKQGTPSNDIYKDWSTEIWYFGTTEDYPKLHWE